MKNLISTVSTSLFSLQRFCFHIIQMGSPCGKDLCGRLRKNNVFPASEISPFVSIVISCTKGSTRSLQLMTGQLKKKITSLHSAVPKTWICIQKNIHTKLQDPLFKMFRYLFYQRKASLRLRYKEQKLHCFCLLNYMQICIAVNILLHVHQIHLAESIRHTEHLYVNNCFIFEYINGLIIKHIHGTQGVDTQITIIISMLKD